MKTLNEAMKEFEVNEKKEYSYEEAEKIAGKDFMKLRNASNLGDAYKTLNALKKKNPDMPENDFKKKALLGLDSGSWNHDKVYKDWIKSNLDKILKKQEKEAKDKIGEVKNGIEAMMKAKGFEGVKITKADVKADKKGVSGKIEIVF